MPGKIVGPGWLNRANLVHEVGREDAQLRLVLVNKSGKLETIDGLFRTQLGGKIEEAQQAPANSMRNKERRQKRAGLDGYQRRPFPCRTPAEVGGQPANCRLLHQRGMREPGTKPFLHANQHACCQQRVPPKSEEVFVQPDRVDLEQSFPYLLKPRFDGIEMVGRRWR
jgi:hypothetical protein